MTIAPSVPPRPRGVARMAPLARSIVLLGLAAVAACETTDAPSIAALTTPSAVPTAVQATPPPPTPTPSPTPVPTPRFTNQADAELSALIPESAGGVEVVTVGVDEHGLTPGDVGTAYGEIGNRFSALAIGYVSQPRTTLYAMRVDGEPVTTAELEPHLATAGRYVGIAGLDPEPWQARTVADREVWVRPEDNATAAGTMIYTWSSGEFVFLLIGVDDAVNQALVGALPESPPAEPGTSAGPSASDSPGASARPSGTEAATPVPTD